MNVNEISEIVIKYIVEKRFFIFGTTIQGSGLHECDVLGINKNEYIYEFEIKRSRADYQADFKKTYKHKHLANKDSLREYNSWRKGIVEKVQNIIIPNRFFYVCEKNLIKKEEVPKYAGLLYITEKKEIENIKNAPLLHKNKANKELYRRIASILSQRIIYGCSYYTYLKKKKF